MGLSEFSLIEDDVWDVAIPEGAVDSQPTLPPPDVIVVSQPKACGPVAPKLDSMAQERENVGIGKRWHHSPGA
eukprot:4022268-Amphidinium_carterae.1